MIRISSATSNDCTELASLFDQYRIFYNMKSDINSSAQFIEKRLDKKDALLFLAKEGIKACGFIQIYPAFSSVAMQPIWILNDLFVNSEHRNKGCARLLMEYVEAQAKQNNVFSIKLATAIDNIKAKRLYQSLNYKKVDAFDHYSLRIKNG